MAPSGRFAGLSRLVSRALAAVAPAPPAPTPTPAPGKVQPQPPEIFVFPPEDETGPMVPVRFVVSDPTNARIDVKVEYSFGGGPFLQATAAPTSDRTTDIAAPDLEVDYRFVWNALADVGAVQGAAQIRMTPSRPGVQGQPSVAGCTLDTTAGSPPPPLPAPPPPLAPTIVVNAGDNQIGISGRLLSDPLSVEVVDGAGQPVLGAAIAWSVGSGVQADVEPWAYRSMGVDWTGLAFAQIRFRPGFVGAGTIRARTFGSTTDKAAFTFDSACRLVHEAYDFKPAVPLGSGYSIDHLDETRVLDGDGVVREWTQDTTGPAARGPVTWKTTRGDRGRITKVDPPPSHTTGMATSSPTRRAARTSGTRGTVSSRSHTAARLSSRTRTTTSAASSAGRTRQARRTSSTTAGG